MRIGRLRWWHALLLAGLAAAGIVAAASWVILLVYGPSLTRERVEAMLSGALGEPTRVGAVHLQPWRGRVSLVDLEVPASPAPSSTRARAAAIDVSVDIASLWRREVTISVLATGLDLDATVPQGKAGGPGLLPLPEHFQVGPVRVGIGSVRIRRSRAVVRDPDAWSIEAAGADLTARPVAGDLDISGRLDALRVEALGHREQIDQVAVDGRLSADLLGVRAIAWLWQGEAMRLDGEVRHPWDAGRELSLRAEGAVALAAVARAADIDQKIEGRAQIAAGVTGPAAAPRIEARIRVPQLDVAGIAVREMSVDGRWVDRALRIDDIQARLGTGRLRGRLEATPIPAGGARISLDLGEVVLPGSLTDLGAGTASAEGRLRAGGIDVTRAQARWRGVSASLDGRIAADPSLAVRARLGVELPEISRSIGAASLGGRADISAELTRRGQAPQLEGRVGVADLVYAGHSVEPVEVSFRMAASSGQDGRWEGALRSSRIRWDQLTVDDISASLALDAQRIELIGGRARAAAIPVEVSGQWEWAGAGRGRAALGPVSLAAVPGVPAELRLGGTGRAIVDASFERGVASATALAKLDRVSAAGLALGAGDADVRLRDRALEGKLSFPSRRLTAKAAGRLESGGALTGSVELDDLALSPLLRELGSDDAADHVAGRLSARGELSIPLEQPAGGRGAVRLTARDLVILGEPWASQGPIVLRWEAAHLIVEHFRLDGPLGSLSATGSLGGGPEDRGLSLSLANARLPGALAPLGEGAVRAEMRLAGGGVELARLDARWPGLAAAATGHAGAGGAMAFSGRADGELARLGPALGVPGIGGRATLTADGRASGEAIEVAGAVRAPRLELHGVPVSELELPFKLSRATLRVDSARAMLGTGKISADASASWKDAGSLAPDSLAQSARVKAEIRAPALRLEDLAPLLPPPLQGHGELALSARAEGTPRAWRGTGALTSSLVELRPGPLRQLRAAFALDGSHLEVTDLSVDALGVPVRGTATWAWTGAGSAKATLGPASLAGLSMIPPGSDLRGTGRAAIDAAIRGPADVSGNVHAVLDDVAVGGVPFGRGQLEASARDGVVRAELAFPEQRLQASGSGRIDADGVLAAEAVLPAVDLAPVARALGLAHAAIEGSMAARATARIPLAGPGRAEGVLSIDPVRVAVAGDQWESRGPIQVRWAEGGLSLAEFTLAARKEGLVSGAGVLGADGKLDARASAHVPLAMLAALRPEPREIGGVLDLSLRASGSAAAPTFSGDGAIHRGNLLLRERPETLRDVEARFSVSAQGVQLREATASVGGGHVQARGDLALRGWQLAGYRVKLQAQNVALGLAEGFSSAWDADLELSGITREAQIEGRARLVRGLYSRDVTLLSMLLSPSRATAADTGTPLRLRVRVDLDDNLVLRSRTADLRAGGVLSVEGTSARPVVFGSVESRDGRINFRGRDWSVTSAAVRFADPRRIDPFLDVLATSRINIYDVTMQITGPVSNVTVRFSSTPRLSQNDLLSLVAFGATGTDLRDSPVTVLLSETGKMLAQNVLGVEPSVTGLRISTSSSTDSELRGFEGDERSTVAGPSTTSGGRRERVRVEYQLLAPLFLSGEYDRDGGYGADVILRFRFR